MLIQALWVQQKLPFVNCFFAVNNHLWFLHMYIMLCWLTSLIQGRRSLGAEWSPSPGSDPGCAETLTLFESGGGQITPTRLKLPYPHRIFRSSYGLYYMLTASGIACKNRQPTVFQSYLTKRKRDFIPVNCKKCFKNSSIWNMTWKDMKTVKAKEIVLSMKTSYVHIYYYI